MYFIFQWIFKYPDVGDAEILYSDKKWKDEKCYPYTIPMKYFLIHIWTVRILEKELKGLSWNFWYFFKFRSTS